MSPTSSVTPEQDTGRPAAYFDLDKTILATSTAFALSTPMHRSGLLSTVALARGVVAQLPYLLIGAGASRTNRLMDRLATLTAGVPRRRLQEVVEGALATAIEPAVYAEALDLIAGHRQAGHDVVVVSASLAEIVEPVARVLGADRAVATTLEVDADGRFTGRIRRRLLHEEKSRALMEDAQTHGVDLTRSWAYSDSSSDEPMLTAVGHPVAVNPDRSLRRLAESRGWPVRDFERPVTLRTTWQSRWPALPRPRGPLPSALAGSLCVLATAGTTAWLVARRPG
ncbi:HAD-IB family hydrolase [Actinomyces sp. 2119]|uniref:HAD-IB family hydrolase n=1 Tax=Actinomyces lilanjuaniae TaxID=2321394 RepID=A0ABN5PU76_9ACTO|nr:MULTISPECIES: HAD-IB family hydrolase [Actinomyces]AYD90561.1 HAD-IB family hydrolase [Actinomyces lilanjuaniae]RJF43987.1 HAD-IB family hydrolase [Actinomyces sp. 2119]